MKQYNFLNEGFFNNLFGGNSEPEYGEDIKDCAAFVAITVVYISKYYQTDPVLIKEYKNFVAKKGTPIKNVVNCAFFAINEGFLKNENELEKQLYYGNQYLFTILNWFQRNYKKNVMFRNYLAQIANSYR